MVRPASDNLEWLEQAEPSEANASDLAERLRSRPISDESELADVIDADGRARLRRGLDTPLERYLAAAPGIERMPVALDAAIEAALRWMCSSGRTEEEAVASLIDAHPHMAGAIVDAVTLNRGVWSTRWLIDRLGDSVERDLPCEIGPAIDEGGRRYRLVKVLGRGSCGEVYLAIDRKLSEDDHDAMVAVKLLDARGAGEHARRRFLNEATRARRVEHPSIVRALDRGEADGDVLYIVYECVRGKTLARWVREHAGRVGPREAARLVADVARGVHAAHASGLIHCDLHPTNVLIDEEGRARICDFGIAVLADEIAAGQALGAWGGRALGSLAFIPPEQYGLEARAFGAAADVYALGGLLHFMLTGDLPNGVNADEIHEGLGAGRGAGERLRARGNDGLDRDLNAIRLRALTTDPTQRQASAGALADDLESWLALRPIEWTSPSPLRRTALFVRRRPVVTVFAILALIGAIVGASALSYTIGVVHSRKQGLMRWYDGVKEQQAEIKTQSDGAAVVLPLWMFSKIKADRALGGDGMVPSVANTEELGVLDRMVEEGYAQSEAPDPVVLLMETTQAYLMLINAEPHEEVFDVIAHNRAQWSRIVPDDARILRDLDMLEAVAVVKQQYLRSKRGRPFDVAALRGAEKTLLASLENYTGWYAGSDYHRLALRALRNLYGPILLKEAVPYELYRRAYLELVPDSKYPGVTPQSDWTGYAEWRKTYQPSDAAHKP